MASRRESLPSCEMFGHKRMIPHLSQQGAFKRFKSQRLMDGSFVWGRIRLSVWDVPHQIEREVSGDRHFFGAVTAPQAYLFLSQLHGCERRCYARSASRCVHKIGRSGTQPCPRSAQSQPFVTMRNAGAKQSARAASCQGEAPRPLHTGRQAERAWAA